MPHPQHQIGPAMQTDGVITRRNMPHWYVPGAMHFVTYRLAGTIPVSVLHELRERRQARLREKANPDVSLSQHRAQEHNRFFGTYDRYLHTHCQIAWLSEPAVAAMIRGNL